MKILSLIFLTLFLGKGCSDSNSEEIKNSRVEYTAISRGYYQNIVVKNKEMVVQNDRNGLDKKTISISESDWKEMVAAFQLIELEKIATYKDPTQKRFSDGAAIANVKITFKEKEYQSVEFDHGMPPVEMEKLINKIVELAKQK
jgi:hypothetical protein